MQFFDKTAASKLRSMLELVKNPKQIKGQTRYILRLKKQKEYVVGNLFVNNKHKSVVSAYIRPEYRNLGLSKKLYGGVLREWKKLRPDHSGLTSRKAELTWESLRKRYSHWKKGVKS